MILIELDGPGAEPVTVAEAKAFARIERDDEDALLALLISAARQSVEQATALVLARRRMRVCADEVPRDRVLDLRKGPVRAIESVTGYDSEGTASVAADGATIAADGRQIRLGEEPRDVCGGVELTVEIGHDPAEVPEPLRLAILQITAASFEVRAAVLPGQQPGIVPATAAALIAPFRRVSLR